jgi:hypothetical protein
VPREARVRERRLGILVEQLSRRDEVTRDDVGEVLRQAAQIAPHVLVEELGRHLVGERGLDGPRQGVLVTPDRAVLGPGAPIARLVARDPTVAAIVGAPGRTVAPGAVVAAARRPSGPLITPVRRPARATVLPSPVAPAIALTVPAGTTAAVVATLVRPAAAGGGPPLAAGAVAAGTPGVVVLPTGPLSAVVVTDAPAVLPRPVVTRARVTSPGTVGPGPPVLAPAAEALLTSAALGTPTASGASGVTTRPVTRAAGGRATVPVAASAVVTSAVTGPIGSPGPRAVPAAAAVTTVPAGAIRPPAVRGGGAAALAAVVVVPAERPPGRAARCRIAGTRAASARAVPTTAGAASIVGAAARSATAIIPRPPTLSGSTLAAVAGRSLGPAAGFARAGAAVTAGVGSRRGGAVGTAVLWIHGHRSSS